MQVKDHAFLVTGGGSGLGAACARRLLEQGGSVVIADLSPEGAALLLEEFPETARAVATNVTDPTSVQQAIDTALREFGALHGVIQCAGIIGGARVVGKEGPHDLEQFRKIIEVNLIGTFNVARLAAATMAANATTADGERGVLVHTSSISAFEGQIGQAAYSASKGGVASMTLPMARELARFGIRVVAIAPGVIRTPMIDALPEANQQSLASQAVFPARLGQPEEIAQFVQQIVENPLLNGAVLRIDGAMRMGAK